MSLSDSLKGMSSLVSLDACQVLSVLNISRVYWWKTFKGLTVIVENTDSK